MQPYNWYNKWLGVPIETAIRDKYAFGVFMVYTKVHTHHKIDDLLDADYNINVAWQLSNEGKNTNPWNASKDNCWGL